MTDFEDNVRRVMREHDSEAPTDLTLPTRPPDRSLSWLPVAAAAAVVLIVVGITLALGTHGSSSPGTARNSDGSLVCPSSYDRSADNHEWVPAKPTVPGATTHLVPNRTPATAVVCAYLGSSTQSDATSRQALHGSRQLSGNLSTVADSLGGLHGGKPTTTYPPCELYGTFTQGDNYLIGLTYGSRTLWVSTPGDHCSAASNGAFQTRVNLLAFASTSYASGRWSPVPKGATSLTATRFATTPRSQRGHLPVAVKEIRAVSAAVNASFAAGRRGHTNALGPGVEYALHFHFDTGPDVWINFDSTGNIGVGTTGTTDVTNLRQLTKLVDLALHGR